MKIERKASIKIRLVIKKREGKLGWVKKKKKRREEGKKHQHASSNLSSRGFFPPARARISNEKKIWGKQKTGQHTCAAWIGRREKKTLQK